MFRKGLFVFLMLGNLWQKSNKNGFPEITTFISSKVLLQKRKQCRTQSPICEPLVQIVRQASALCNVQKRRLKEPIAAPFPAGVSWDGAEWLWEVRPSLLTCQLFTAMSFYSDLKVSTDFMRLHQMVFQKLTTQSTFNQWVPQPNYWLNQVRRLYLWIEPSMATQFFTR